MVRSSQSAESGFSGEASPPQGWQITKGSLNLSVPAVAGGKGSLCCGALVWDGWRPCSSWR